MFNHLEIRPSDSDHRTDRGKTRWVKHLKTPKGGSIGDSFKVLLDSIRDLFIPY